MVLCDVANAIFSRFKCKAFQGATRNANLDVKGILLSDPSYCNPATYFCLLTYIYIGKCVAENRAERAYLVDAHTEMDPLWVTESVHTYI